MGTHSELTFISYINTYIAYIHTDGGTDNLVEVALLLIEKILKYWNWIYRHCPYLYAFLQLI